MVFAKRLREGVRQGQITCSVRIWTRPHVIVGNRYRMDEGEIEIDSITPSVPDITPELARESGFLGVVDLLKIAKHGKGDRIYLIRFHYIPPRKTREDRPTRNDEQEIRPPPHKRFCCTKEMRAVAAMRGLSFVLVFACGFCWAESCAFRSAQALEKQPERVRSHVDYTDRVNALEAIVAVGLQTKTPIGIIPGRDTTSICRSQYPFDLRDLDAASALLDIARRTQYSLTEENGVFLITAPDTHHVNSRR